MSSHSPQMGGSNQPNKNKDQVFLLLFILLNGISTGSLIRTGRYLVGSGSDKDYIIPALLWLGCTIYTAQRAYEIYKKVHKDNDKNNQR